MSDTSDHTTIPFRICTKCLIAYPATLEYFYRSKRGKYGLDSVCKSCGRAEARERHFKHRNQNNERSRQWRLRNPERKKEHAHQWHAENREKENERNRQWKKEHPGYREKYRLNEYAQTKRYKQANREKVRVWSKRGKAKRRALKLAAQVTNSPFDEKLQLKRQKGKCYYCGGKLLKYHIDHVIPLSRGGADHPDNKVLACPPCNQKKHNKMPHEWAAGGRLL